MSEAIIVINSGSASLKFSLFQIDNCRLLFNGYIEKINDAPELTITDAKGVICDKTCYHLSDKKDGHEVALVIVREWIKNKCKDYNITAIGHRVVHGGSKYFRPTIIDDDVIKDLESFIPLAPLHQADNLLPIKALRKELPKIPQIACFDTAFHHAQKDIAKLYAIPKKYTDQGILRYGFHGLSYEYIAQSLPEFIDHKADNKIVIAHLGHGASMCAMENRRSVATTMGFSALAGLPMGSCSGNIDPGVLLYFLTEEKFTANQLSDFLYNECGLLGVSGISSDVRELLHSDSDQAKLALDLFIYRCNRELGSMIAALGGIDILIFTGGIAENEPLIREKICKLAKWTGVKLDEKANHHHEVLISHPDSKVEVLVIPTNEELMIAIHTAIALAQYEYSDDDDI